nr:uncharacterized protein CG13380 [Halyomorpha halys]
MDPRRILGPSKDCICDRPKTKIMCTNCDYVSFGRVRRTCNLHPYVTYLMDLIQCPKCNRKCYETGEPCFDVRGRQVVSPSAWKF